MTASEQHLAEIRAENRRRGIEPVTWWQASPLRSLALWLKRYGIVAACLLALIMWVIMQ